MIKNTAGKLRSAIERALAAADIDDLCPTLQMAILANQLATLVAKEPREDAHFDELLDRVLLSLAMATRAERAERIESGLQLAVDGMADECLS